MIIEYIDINNIFSKRCIMTYVAISSFNEDNKIKIYEDYELLLKENRPIFYDDFIINKTLNNIELTFFNLNKITENESLEWLQFYNKKTWENIFWLLGYDIYERLDENEIIEDIKKNKSEIILFYIQNIPIVFNIFNKGEKFKRFKKFCEYYEKETLKNEKNQMFLSLIKKFKEDWSIII